jgi:NADH-quinone oxidoreductase subunit C
VNERLTPTLADLGVEELESADGMPTYVCTRERLLELMTRLRDQLGFETNTIVTAIDLFPAEPRFRLVYQLLSIAHNERVRIECDVPAEDAHVPTVTGLWPGASFFERETWDMFGVRFDGHPDLRRLLMPEGFTHHPLRKDFPHQGIEPDRLYREWDAQRRRSEPTPAETGGAS